VQIKGIVIECNSFLVNCPSTRQCVFVFAHDFRTLMKRAFDGFIKPLCFRLMECQEGHIAGVFSCLHSGISPQVEKAKIRREQASSMLPLRLTEAW